MATLKAHVPRSSLALRSKGNALVPLALDCGREAHAPRPSVEPHPFPPNDGALVGRTTQFHADDEGASQMTTLAPAARP